MWKRAACVRSYSWKKGALTNPIFWLHLKAHLSGAHCPGSSKHCRGDLTGQGLPSIGKRPRSMVRNMRLWEQTAVLSIWTPSRTEKRILLTRTQHRSQRSKCSMQSGNDPTSRTLLLPGTPNWKASPFRRNSQALLALLTYSAKWSGVSLLLMASQDRIAGGLMFLSRKLICISLWNADEHPQNKLCSSAYLQPCSTIPSKSLLPTQNGSSWLIKLKIQVQGAQQLVFQGEMQLELENPGQVSPREFKFRAFSLTEWL